MEGSSWSLMNPEHIFKPHRKLQSNVNNTNTLIHVQWPSIAATCIVVGGDQLQLLTHLLSFCHKSIADAVNHILASSTRKKSDASEKETDKKEENKEKENSK